MWLRVSYLALSQVIKYKNKGAEDVDIVKALRFNPQNWGRKKKKKKVGIEPNVFTLNYTPSFCFLKNILNSCFLDNHTVVAGIRHHMTKIKHGPECCEHMVGACSLAGLKFPTLLGEAQSRTVF